jgi:hypothetical protein
VLRHRYTGEEYQYSGTPDLDSPTYHVEPHRGAPAPCGPFLTKWQRRLLIAMCGTITVVKGCPHGCYALAGNLDNGAYVEDGRLRQVAMPSGRLVRAWRLPAGRRQRIKLTVTRDAVFVSLLVGDTWRVLRGKT